MSDAFVPFGVVRSLGRGGVIADLVDALPYFVSNGPIGPSYVELLRSEIARRNAGSDRFEEIKLCSGIRLKVDLHDNYGALLAYGYLQERAELDFLARIVSAKSVIVDVGANIGVFTTTLARRLEAGGKIFSFEPVPETFSVLDQNIAENELYPLVKPFEMCVGQIEGEQPFHVAANASLSGLVDTKRSRSHRTISRFVTTLDGLPDLKGLSVDLLKIDTEGSEHEVLIGSRDVIKRSPEIVIFFELSHKNLTPETFQEVSSVLADLLRSGFVGFGFQHGELRPLPLSLDAFSGNLIFCRRSSGSYDRLHLAAGAERDRTRPSTKDRDEQKERALLAIIELARFHLATGEGLTRRLHEVEGELRKLRREEHLPSMEHVDAQPVSEVAMGRPEAEVVEEVRSPAESISSESKCSGEPRDAIDGDRGRTVT